MARRRKDDPPRRILTLRLEMPVGTEVDVCDEHIRKSVEAHLRRTGHPALADVRVISIAGPCLWGDDYPPGFRTPT